MNLSKIPESAGAPPQDTVPNNPVPETPMINEDQLRYHTLTGGGYAHTCAIVEEGKVKCWGNNLKGQLGNGTYISSLSPVFVQSLVGVVSLAGTDDANCALLDTGKVHCWGTNSSGALGIGDLAVVNSYLPLEVSGLENVVGIDGTDAHFCALLKDRTVSCWGLNNGGQIGDGTTSARAAPFSVPGIDSVKAVYAGARHSCAILENGAVKCWGQNLNSQASGDSVPTANVFSPVIIPNLPSTAEGFSGSYKLTCVVLGDQSVSCWGKTSAGSFVTAYNVPQMATAKVVSGGWDHVCALLSNKSLVCQGVNNSGVLGDGTVISQTDPVPVNGLTGVKELAASDEHNCVRLENDSIQCWGLNNNGQLGNNSTTNSSVPVAVIGL